MLRCLFLRRKLYDYIDNSLSEIDRIRVNRHINLCDKCKERLNKIRTILDLAVQRKSPRPTDEFWYNFKIDLDRRLNEKLATPIILKQRLTYRLKPALAYTLILIFILTIGIYFHKEHRPLKHLAQAEYDTLVDEIILLEEVSEAVDLDDYEDSYIEEIELVYQLDSSAT